MRFTLLAFIKDHKIVTRDMSIYSFYDPNGLAEKYNDSGIVVEVDVKLIVSKKSNKLVALVENIKTTERSSINDCY